MSSALVTAVLTAGKGIVRWSTPAGAVRAEKYIRPASQACVCDTTTQSTAARIEALVSLFALRTRPSTSAAAENTAESPAMPVNYSGSNVLPAAFPSTAPSARPCNAAPAALTLAGRDSPGHDLIKPTSINAGGAVKSCIRADDHADRGER
jgi:hypothetical protein